MSEERTRILNMVATGKISADEAERLLEALKTQAGGETAATAATAEGNRPRGKAKYLRVKVASSNGENVDVRVPLDLVRSGMKLTSLLPPEAVDKINSSMQEHGLNFDLNSAKREDIEALLDGLAGMEVNVASQDGDNVHVFCE